MAASDEQKLKTRLFLGITKEDASKSEAEGDDEDGLYALLDALDAAELEQLDTYLVEAAEVDTDVTEIAVDGVSIKPAKKRALLQDRICTLVGVGVNPGFYTVGTASDTQVDPWSL